MKKSIKIILAVVIILAVIISVYIYTLQNSVIVGEEKQQILAYSEPITDNILQGYNEGDYEKISRDFTAEMKNSFTEAVFLENRELILSKIGSYISHDIPTILNQPPYKIVIYNAEFEKESGVQVRVVFIEHIDKNLVTGLWFNSPKLRE